MSQPPYRVLFVCMGNICRSPAAEIVFRKLVHDEGLDERIEIDSAGTIGYHAGNPPDHRMSATLENRGYEITGQSRQIKAPDLDAFDLVLVADNDNLNDVKRLDIDQKHLPKIKLITDYCVEKEAKHVPDPYYGGASGFEEVADLVEDACAGLLDHLKKHEL
ncbi:low molecular weight protein-tyrosine-phosphatase [Haloferula chungangensis]|uniref:Low molecular weight protein-tyrosine-phosphatase n=1 Tax=Haloferula chungangensis TaxID=1048331 RepID=A0ABW2L8U2_9BACT